MCSILRIISRKLRGFLGVPSDRGEDVSGGHGTSPVRDPHKHAVHPRQQPFPQVDRNQTISFDD